VKNRICDFFVIRTRSVQWRPKHQFLPLSNANLHACVKIHLGPLLPHPYTSSANVLSVCSLESFHASLCGNLSDFILILTICPKYRRAGAFWFSWQRSIWFLAVTWFLCTSIYLSNLAQRFCFSTRPFGRSGTLNLETSRLQSSRLMAQLITLLLLTHLQTNIMLFWQIILFCQILSISCILY